MKTSILVLSLLTLIIPLNAQNSNQPTEEEKKQLEGVDDSRNKLRRWEAIIGDGHYSVALSAITSVSKHSYLLNGNVVVTEVTIDTTGNTTARFYYLEPLAQSSTLSTIQRITKRAEELRQQGRDRTGISADQMVQKSYPHTTHAKTVEYRVQYKVELDALFQSAYTAWTRAHGRTFKVQQK